MNAARARELTAEGQKRLHAVEKEQAELDMPKVIRMIEQAARSGKSSVQLPVDMWSTALCEKLRALGFTEYDGSVIW